MFSKIVSAAVNGIDAYPVNVEVDLSPGLPMYATVGLPDTAVKESKDRVLAALKNSGFDLPSKRITVNLAPADVRKEGASFDLPIALGILTAKEILNKESTEGFCAIGELALDGKLRPVKGVLPVALGLLGHGISKLILPRENAKEAAIVKGLEVYPSETLAQAVAFLNGEQTIERFAVEENGLSETCPEDSADFSEVKGQYFAKRALEIAAAGGHNVIMTGSPGSGKTMLARRLPSILPSLSFEESIETSKIHSVAGLLPPGRSLIAQKPFRSPHHTISDIALIGGGQTPRPGEVSLAHNGVLFLDELPEFHRDVLEVLRQPLEDHVVNISRAKQSLTFPAYFMLVGSMNPCPCGNLGHPEKECLCSPYQIQKYRAKVSGPLMDRIDMHLEVPALKLAELTQEGGSGESSASIRERVLRARAMQKKRFSGKKIHCNAQMTSRMIRKYCRLSGEPKELLMAAAEKMGFSGRAYDRVLKVARTIADIEGNEEIGCNHISEAVQYRGNR